MIGNCGGKRGKSNCHKGSDRCPSPAEVKNSNTVTTFAIKAADKSQYPFHGQIFYVKTAVTQV